jgi:hypothetical protein
MPHCPECLTEYREGAMECIDCGVPLEPGPPPPPPSSPKEPNLHFVPVRVFKGLQAQFEADLARNLLRAEGIPCTVTGELGAELLPGADRVLLLVRQDDEARASEIVAAFLDENQQAKAQAGEEVQETDEDEPA